MQGRRSLNKELSPFIDNIHRVKHRSRKLDNQYQEEEVQQQLQATMGDNVARQMMNKEFARPIIGTATSCIRLTEAARNYELKNIHYSMLPSFYGIPNEDPLNFMRELYATVQTFPLQGLSEDQLRMRCFPYTLKDRAKSWLMTLAPGSLVTWDDVYNKFMGKFYSHQKTSDLRTKIATFSQMDGEPFHEAWDRFKLLLIQCPHHHFPLQLQNQFFYDGLTLQCQFTVDNAAGGAMGEKTADETYELFEMLGANSQQKSARGRRAGVHELGSNNEMAMQLAELTKQVQLLTTSNVNQMPKHEVCGVCGSYGHGANVCSFAGDPYTGTTEEANLMQGYQPRPRNDPYSNTYNPGWRNHPNFGWKQNNSQPFVQNQTQGQNVNRPFPQNKPTVEDTLNNFIQSCSGRMDSMEASMKRVEMQVGQLAEQMHKQETGKLPSQPEQAKAVTVLRSGKVVNKILPELSNDLPYSAGNMEDDNNASKELEERGDKHEEPSKATIGESSNPPTLHKSSEPYRPPIPFPHRLKDSKQDKQFSDLFNMLSKVNINLTLLDVIRNVPSYAKFFKELNTKKRRYELNERVIVSEIASAVLQRNLPPKLKDSGSFIIDITMGDRKVAKAMLDLGASINLMPYSIFL